MRLLGHTPPPPPPPQVDTEAVRDELARDEPRYRLARETLHEGRNLAQISRLSKRRDPFLHIVREVLGEPER